MYRMFTIKLLLSSYLMLKYSEIVCDRLLQAQWHTCNPTLCRAGRYCKGLLYEVAQAKETIMEDIPLISHQKTPSRKYTEV